MTDQDPPILNLVGDAVMFWCPGCDEPHAVNTGPGGWTFNRNLTAPTFQPSVLVNRGSRNESRPVCHSFVTDGSIRFLGDSTHDLSGQTVALPPWQQQEGTTNL